MKKLRNSYHDWPLIEYWLNALATMKESERYKRLTEYAGDFCNIDSLEGYKKGLLGTALINAEIERDPLGTVLKAHLILENILDAIIKKRVPKMSKKLLVDKNFGFYKKTDMLQTKRLLKNDICNDLKTINKIRNHYGHDYYYDIGNFDMSIIHNCENIYKFFPTNNKTKSLLNINVFRMFIIRDVLFRMTKSYPFIENLKLQKEVQNFNNIKNTGNIINLLIKKVERWGCNWRINFIITRKNWKKEMHIALKKKN